MHIQIEIRDGRQRAVLLADPTQAHGYIGGAHVESA